VVVPGLLPCLPDLVDLRAQKERTPDIGGHIGGDPLAVIST
jgi:hypothetical protein